MLHLKTAKGERLEILASAIIAVMKPSDGVNPSAIIFDMGSGAQVEQLSDQYGFVKKLVVDASAMVNPVEVRIIEQVAVGEGADAVTAHGEGRMFFPRDRIKGRREVKGDANGINAILYVDLLGKPMPINIADTLDELDGVEVAKVEPAPKAMARPAKSRTPKAA